MLSVGGWYRCFTRSFSNQSEDNFCILIGWCEPDCAGMWKEGMCVEGGGRGRGCHQWHQYCVEYQRLMVHYLKASVGVRSMLCVEGDELWGFAVLWGVVEEPV